MYGNNWTRQLQRQNVLKSATADSRKKILHFGKSSRNSLSAQKEVSIRGFSMNSKKQRYAAFQSSRVDFVFFSPPQTAKTHLQCLP